MLMSPPSTTEILNRLLVLHERSLPPNYHKTPATWTDQPTETAYQLCFLARCGPGAYGYTPSTTRAERAFLHALSRDRGDGVVVEVNARPGGLRKLLGPTPNKFRAILCRVEEAKLYADRLLTEYRDQLASARDEANRIIEEARTTADQMRRDLNAKAEREAQGIVDRANDEIRAERDRVFAELKAQVGDIAVELAGRVVGRTLDTQTHERLIDDYIAEVARGGNGNGHGNGEGGDVSMILLLAGGSEVEIRLPGRFKVSPQIAGAIKAVPGVVDVEAL